MRGTAVAVFEQPGEVEPGQAGGSGNDPQVDRVAIAVVDELFGLHQVADGPGF